MLSFTFVTVPTTNEKLPDSGWPTAGLGTAFAAFTTRALTVNELLPSGASWDMDRPNSAPAVSVIVKLWARSSVTVSTIGLAPSTNE